jgi:hypothetical protein
MADLFRASANHDRADVIRHECVHYLLNAHFDCWPEAISAWRQDDGSWTGHCAGTAAPSDPSQLTEMVENVVCALLGGVVASCIKAGDELATCLPDESQLDVLFAKCAPLQLMMRIGPIGNAHVISS